MADRLKPSELVSEVKRLQEQVDGLTEALERIVARLDRLEAGRPGAPYRPGNDDHVG